MNEELQSTTVKPPEGSLAEKATLRFDQTLTVESSHPDYVPQLVDAILASASDEGASDVHLVPCENGLVMSWRLNGVLQPVATFPNALKANIVARLKVLAELLTYRTDVPQEGRIAGDVDGVETRVSTFPTLFGEKAVIRLFVGSGDYRRLNDLQLPSNTTDELKRGLVESGGVILLTGPAGSGKTTTAYACLREIVASSISRSVATLEDPVEAVVEGAAQSQIKPSAGFDYETGLKSLLRQDPEVMLVGEIRDAAAAKLVFQTALTGHLVLTTFHAGSAGEAVARLLDMGIEPYQLRSGILGVLNQRLFRVLCSCAVEGENPDGKLGLIVDRFREPVGCERCGGTGYRGRQPLVEMLTVNDRQTATAVLSRSDSADIEKFAVEAGMITRWDHAREAVNSGQTSPAEIRRVLGFRPSA